MGDTYLTPLKARLHICDYASKLYSSAEVFAAVQTDILGFIAFYVNDRKTRTSYIPQIAVKGNFQDNGISGELLNFCVESSIARGMYYIKLEVNKNNKRAIKFYEKNGFVFLGESSSESIYMQKNLLECKHKK